MWKCYEYLLADEPRGRGAVRAEDAHGTTIKGHIPLSVPVYKDKTVDQLELFLVPVLVLSSRTYTDRSPYTVCELRVKPRPAVEQ